jgi:hypothetical protein
MAVSWTTIPDTDVDAESPFDVDLATAYRDNPIAIAEGASGAPKIQLDAAFDSAIASEGIEVISTSGTWVPAAGLYNMVKTSGTGQAIYEIYVNSAWRGLAVVGTSTPMNLGLAWFDGTNMRIRESFGVASVSVAWQKMT